MCGIYGIYSLKYNNTIINELLCGLKLLQHRGHDSYGFSYINSDNKIKLNKYSGLIPKTINFNDIITKCVIGHIRYTTSGQSVNGGFVRNGEIQPFIGKTFNNNLVSIVHNGNIPNINSTQDTQYIFNKIIKSYDDIETTLKNMVDTIPAAYSLLVIYDNNLYVIKDRYGIRPLSIGINKDTNNYHISSETIGLENCRDIFEVGSGEIIRINNKGHKKIYRHPTSNNNLCVFELIYFMNPLSYYYDKQVKIYRQQLANVIALKDLNKFDKNNTIVCGVPLSGILYGETYANFLNLCYKQVLEKNDNTNSTFILLNNEDRICACNNKFKYNIELIKNKNIIIVDDSIVRGNVIQSIINNLKKYGAKQIHIRIPSPPIVDICQLGISIQTKQELIMYNKTINEVKDILEVDSLNYLELKDLDMIFKYDYYGEYFGKKINNTITNFIE